MKGTACRCAVSWCLRCTQSNRHYAVYQRLARLYSISSRLRFDGYQPELHDEPNYDYFSCYKLLLAAVVVAAGEGCGKRADCQVTKSLPTTFGVVYTTQMYAQTSVCCLFNIWSSMAGTFGAYMVQITSRSTALLFSASTFCALRRW